ncbi:MAG: hypothetical protein ABFD49_08200 [Armatimonadota bacterium]|nr:CsgG/HfaB family protein [bacterium]
MIKVDRNRLWLSMILIVIFSIVAIGTANAALFGLIKSKKKGAAAVISESLVIFPFDSGETISKLPESFGEDMATALRSMLVGNDQYWVYFYTDRLAPVKRAKDDNLLKTQDASGPFSSDTGKCVKLARLLAADYLICGAVEEYGVDKSTKSAQLTVSVNLVSVKTGKVVRTLLVTGRTPEGASTGDEDDSRALAAGDAIAKLKSQLLQDENDASGSDSTAKHGSSPIVLPAAQAVK